MPSSSSVQLNLSEQPAGVEITTLMIFSIHLIAQVITEKRALICRGLRHILL